MSSGNKDSSSGWLIWGGITLIGILIFVGYRISSVSIGPITLGLDKPENNRPAPTSVPLPTSRAVDQNPTSASVETLPDIDINPALSLPFFDNFDNGISQIWRIVEGTPVISNGKLAGSDSVTLEIGNDTLSRYVVEFDVSGMPDYCTWGYNNYLTIGFSPYLEYRAAYTDMVGRGRWYAYKDGQWKEITRDEIGVGCNSKVKIVVNGNSYKIYANGKISSELIYGTSSGAPFSIGVAKYPLVDNLSIKSP